MKAEWVYVRGSECFSGETTSTKETLCSSPPINKNKRKRPSQCLSPINKKRRKRPRLCLSPINRLRFSLKRRPTYTRRRKRKVRFNKDMLISSNDEAFRLSLGTLTQIICIIRSRKTPTPQTYRRWDKYAMSFYLKMCNCFGVDYQHLEATPEPPIQQQGIGAVPEGMSHHEHMMQIGAGFVLRNLSWAEGEHFEPEKHMEYSGPSQIVKPAKYEMSFDKYLRKVCYNLRLDYCARVIIEGAFDFGSYSPGTRRDGIPYHLYLLLKEAVGIMSSRTNGWKALKTVEVKICFFMTYFHSHLPPGFRYNRRRAKSVVASFESSMHERRYELGGYTLYGYAPSFLRAGWDPRTRLSPKGMVNIMNIIHSRKTPSFWEMSTNAIIFYCKLCSCFGIEYHHLEGASEDDVCLMNMRRG